LGEAKREMKWVENEPNIYEYLTSADGDFVNQGEVIPLSPVDMAKVNVPKKKAKANTGSYDDKFRVIK